MIHSRSGQVKMVRAYGRHHSRHVLRDQVMDEHLSAERWQP